MARCADTPVFFGTLAILVLAAQCQMQAGVTTTANIPLTMAGAAQQVGALNSALTNQVRSAVQGAVSSMPGAQMASAIDSAATSMPGAAPMADALRAAANGAAAAPLGFPAFPTTMSLAGAPIPFINEAQATVNNAVQWAAGLPAAGMQVATGVAQTGANVINSIPAGVAAAMDGPNAAMQAVQRAGTQIPAIGTEFNRAAQGTFAAVNGVLGVPRENLPDLSMPTLPAAGQLPAMSPMMSTLTNALNGVQGAASPMMSTINNAIGGVQGAISNMQGAFRDAMPANSPRLGGISSAQSLAPAPTTHRRLLQRS